MLQQSYFHVFTHLLFQRPQQQPRKIKQLQPQQLLFPQQPLIPHHTIILKSQPFQGQGSMEGGLKRNLEHQYIQ